MPADQCLGFGERRQVVGTDQALHRNCSQVRDFQIVARLQRLDRFRIEAEAEARRVAKQPEKDRLPDWAECGSFGGREQRIDVLAACLHHHHLAADDIAGGACILQ